MKRDERDAVFMTSALDEARAAASAGEVPVGAVIVFGDTIVARSGNRMRRDGEATAHAESLAIRAAYLTLGRPWLEGCTLYVTLEPCAMCAGAIILARFDRIVFGAWDEKAGMAGSVGDLLRHPRLNHRPEVVGGVCADECATLLKAFFSSLRETSPQ